MSSNIAELHKILKDETRRKAIILLHERGSLGYVELMKALDITNTGKMNYHLKILDDLLAKTEDGKYTLTEKGKLASRLLVEFTEGKSQSQIEAELPRWFIIAAVASSAVFIMGVLLMSAIGLLSLSSTVINVFTAVSAIVLLIVFDKARMRRAKWSANRQMLGAEISIIFFAALVGTVVFLFGGSLLLLGIQTLLRSAGIRFTLFSFAWWLLISFIVGPIIGGLVGYFLFKRSKYSNPAYYDAFAGL